MADNPKNSYSSRIQGMDVGDKKPPVNIGSYNYHLMFDDMEIGEKLINLFAPIDSPTIVTVDIRPNMYLEYDPNKPAGTQYKYVSWQYWHYVTIVNGFYGNNYYLFGNGKVFTTLPPLVD